MAGMRGGTSCARDGEHSKSGAIPNQEHRLACAAAHIVNSEALDGRIGVREAALNSAVLADRRESNVGARDACQLKRIKNSYSLWVAFFEYLIIYS